MNLLYTADTGDSTYCPSLMAETPELLDELLRAGAPSGYEGPAAEIWREAASFAVALQRRPRLLDRPDRRGRPRCSPSSATSTRSASSSPTSTRRASSTSARSAAGTRRSWSASGSRCAARTASCPASSAASRSTCSTPSSAKRSSSSRGSTSTSAPPTATRPRELVRVGDPVVIAAEPVALAGDRLVSRSMDNRLGAYVALEALRRCDERGSLTGQLRRGRRRPGGDRPVRRPHLGLRGAPRPRDRRRRHPRHRRPRGRREGGRQPPARLRPGDRPRLDPLAEDLRAARRDRRGGRASSTRSAPAAAAPAPTPT